MSQQPTWAAIEAAIQSAIVSASGFAAGNVVWAYQGANAPSNAYIRLSLGSLLPLFIDWIDERDVPAWVALTAYAVNDRVTNDSNKTYRCTTAGTSAAAGGPTGTGGAITDGSVVWAYVGTQSGIVLTTVGTREVALQLECFTGPAAGSVSPSAGLVEASGATARAVLDEVVTRLRLPTARGLMAAVGVVPFDSSAVNWLPDLVSVGFRGRASCDVRCYMPARALSEYANFIAQISGVATIEGVAGGGSVAVPIAAP